MRTAFAALAALAVAGCPDVPDGRFGCAGGERCPPGMICHPDLLCRRGECTRVCGDATQDGLITSDDGDAIDDAKGGGSALSRCGAMDADVYRGGMITEADLHIVQWMARQQSADGGRGSLPPACEPCLGGDPPAPRRCGDLTGDGNVDANDEIVLRSTSEMIITDGCQFWAADVNGNGVIDSSDSVLLESGAPLVCADTT